MFVQVFKRRLVCGEMERRDGCVERMTDEWEDSVISDVGDGTFAAFLHGDVHVRCGHITFVAILFPCSGPAVTFVLLYDV